MNHPNNAHHDNPVPLTALALAKLKNTDQLTTEFFYFMCERTDWAKYKFRIQCEERFFEGINRPPTNKTVSVWHVNYEEPDSLKEILVYQEKRRKTGRVTQWIKKGRPIQMAHLNIVVKAVNWKNEK